MVTTEVAALLPGVTLAGENEQSAPAGKFEQEKTTTLCTAPETGVTVSLVLPE